MRVLVTGATGFVGRRLVDRLVAEGTAVRATTRLPSRSLPHPGLHWFTCDLGNEEQLCHALSGTETVFHCAALVSAQASLSDYEAINLHGTLRLARLAAKLGVLRIVYLSSIGVYGRPSSPNPFLEEDAAYEDRPADRGPYTQTKLAAERALLEFARENSIPKIIVLRPGTIYGPGAPLPVGRFKLPSSPSRPIVVGSRRVSMPLTYVDNVVEAMLAAARGDLPSGRIYNVVDSAHLDQGEVARALRRVSDGRIRPLFLPYGLVWPMALGNDLLFLLRHRRLGTARYRLRRTLADMRFKCIALRTDLGWEPRVSLTEGLSRALAVQEEKPYPH